MIETLLVVPPTIKIPDSPGPKTIVNGNAATGYFGILPADQFISRATLRTLTGLTAGTDTTFWDGRWTKLILDGKVLYVPLRAPVQAMARTSLQTLGLVYGKEITWNGYKFVVRLAKMTTDTSIGINAEFPVANRPATLKSEWGRIVTAIIDPSISTTQPNFKLLPNASTYVPSNVTFSITQTLRDNDTNTTIVATNTQVSYAPITAASWLWMPILEFVS